MTYHIIPGCHYGLHVEITWEEGNYAIRDNLAVFYKDTSEIPNDRWVISNFKPGTDSNLITSTGDDLFKKFERAGDEKKRTNQRKE